MAPSDAGSTLAESLFRLASLVIRQRPRDISLTAASTLTALERNGPRRLTQLGASGWVGGVLLAFLFLVAVAGPALTGNPMRMDVPARLQAPS